MDPKISYIYGDFGAGPIQVTPGTEGRVRVAVGESGLYQDDFLRNQVALLAEARWSLAVETPAAWVDVDLTA
jgi:hypothetical protein